MSPRRLPWNDVERRLHTPFRPPLTLVVFVAVSLVIEFSLSTALGGLAGPSRPASLVVSLASIGASGLAAFTVVWYVDRWITADLGLGPGHEWAVDLGLGLALRTGLTTATFVIGVAVGWVAVSPAPLDVDRLLGIESLLTFFVAVGVTKELLFRGIVLTDVTEGLRWWFNPDAAVAGGLTVSSTVFDVAHYTDPSAGFVSTTNITLAGVIPGLGYALIGDLVVPASICISRNFVQGSVFNFVVSDLDSGTSLAETTERGPDVITGSTSDLEAGPLGIGAIVFGTARITTYVRIHRGDLGFEPSTAVPDPCWRE